MADPKDARPKPAHPNNLREVREKEQMITREGLSSICASLQLENSALYSTVSLTTLRELEAGKNLPRLRTAYTLAKALGVEPSRLFPLGTDNPAKNPKGNTRISEGRNKGGRPKPR